MPDPSYRLAEEAVQDLDTIWSYVARESMSTEVADRVIFELQKGILFIADMPGVGHSRDDLVVRPVRFWAVYSYLIVYEAHDDQTTNSARRSWSRRPRQHSLITSH